MADDDVLIVGGGMVGLSLAAALWQTPLRVGIIELSDPQRRSQDSRASAIALGSAQILEQMGAWKPMQTLGVSPIHQVVVSDEGFPRTTTLLFGTDLANRLFSNHWLPLQWVRRLGLMGIEHLSPLKRELMQYAMGVAMNHPHFVSL